MNKCFIESLAIQYTQAFNTRQFSWVYILAAYNVMNTVYTIQYCIVDKDLQNPQKMNPTKITTHTVLGLA